MVDLNHRMVSTWVGNQTRFIGSENVNLVTMSLDLKFPPMAAMETTGRSFFFFFFFFFTLRFRWAAIRSDDAAERCALERTTSFFVCLLLSFFSSVRRWIGYVSVVVDRRHLSNFPTVPDCWQRHSSRSSRRFHPNVLFFHLFDSSAGRSAAAAAAVWFLLPFFLVIKVHFVGNFWWRGIHFSTVVNAASERKVQRVFSFSFFFFIFFFEEGG